MKKKIDNDAVMAKELKKIQKNFFKQINSYKDFIRQCELDAPIEVLCLPTALLGILKREGINRVFDLTGRDLAKIKGVGLTRLIALKTSLDKFGFV